MPALTTRSPPFWKGQGDLLSTGVNTKLGTKVETDQEGHVLYVVTPYLVKWGTGLGERLDEVTLLVPAYPQMVEEQREQP